MKPKRRITGAAIVAALALAGCATAPRPAEYEFADSAAAAKAVAAALAVMTPLEAASCLQANGWSIPPRQFTETKLRWAPPQCGAPAVGYVGWLEISFEGTAIPEWSAWFDEGTVIGYDFRVAARDTSGRLGPYSVPYTEGDGPLDPGPDLPSPCPENN